VLLTATTAFQVDETVGVPVRPMLNLTVLVATEISLPALPTVFILNGESGVVVPTCKPALPLEAIFNCELAVNETTKKHIVR
jgi:hypothetical protein